MRNQKRGISDLIATVLMVLIVIAAVGIIWSAISPMFRKQLDKPLLCSAVELTINTEAGYTWYNDSIDTMTNTMNKSVSVMVTSQKVGEMKDIQLMIRDDAGKSATIKVKEDMKQNISAADYEDRTYLLAWDYLKTKGLTATGKPTTVRVVPMILVSGKKESCQPTEEVTLPGLSAVI